MARTLKALSALLAYPSADLKAAVPAIREALGEGLVDPAPLEPLLADLASGDLIDLEERYVALFDRSRTLSLNLFEHIHGESRDRGGAMVDLVEMYRAGGYEPTGRELPDHLPVLLEFLSTRPLAEARAVLADAAHIVEALAVRLRRRDTPYAAVLEAVAAFAAADLDAATMAELTAAPDDDPNDLEALDRAWEETEVTFGPDPNAGCPASRDILARMTPPAAPAWAAPAAE